MQMSFRYGPDSPFGGLGPADHWRAEDPDGPRIPPVLREIPLPTVVEHTARGHEQWDIFSRLLKERIVFLGWQVGSAAANSVIAQLLFLEKENYDDPVSMYINSPGGSIPAGLAIYDVMQYIHPPVYTYCIGHAASMAAVLLAAGEAGHRCALSNSEVLIHQPMVFSEGWSQATDLEIEARHVLQLRERLNRILAKHTGKPLDTIAHDTERDYWMTAEEAKNYGLIDSVIEKRVDEGEPES
jgi:ATP-dependent Clp protease, protease subunit